MKKKGRPIEERIKDIPLDSIDEPVTGQRLLMDEQKMGELKKSIQQFGLINPIELKEKGERFEVVSGSRRLMAHKALKKASIIARISYRTDVDNELAKLHENVIREEITAYEEILALIDIHENHDLHQKKIAESLGKSEAWVSQRLAILDSPEILLDAMKDGVLTFSVARELSLIKDVEEVHRLTTYAVQNGVTPGVARQWRMAWQASQGNGAPDPDGYSENLPENEEKYQFKFECEGCRKHFGLERLRQIKTCPECLEMIRTAIKES